jgi:hypothetical protein
MGLYLVSKWFLAGGFCGHLGGTIGRGRYMSIVCPFPHPGLQWLTQWCRSSQCMSRSCQRICGGVGNQL